MSFDPQPAITGTRPRAASTVSRSPGDAPRWSASPPSPVVPHGTSALLPSAICHSTISANVSSATRPAGKWRHKRRNRAEKHELASDAASFGDVINPGVHRADKEPDCTMSSMWRSAVILPVASRRGNLGLGAIFRACRLPARLRLRSERQHRRLAQQLASAAAEQQLPLCRLCRLPDRQSRLARRGQDAPLGGESHAARARMPPRSSPSSRGTNLTTGNGWARLADAYAATGRMAEALDAARNAWGSPDLSETTSRRSGPAMAPASRAPTTTAASTPCCSPRSRTTRRASSRSPPRHARLRSAPGSRCSAAMPTPTAATSR